MLLLKQNGSSDLYKGNTLAILSSVGNTPCFSDKLHIYASGLTIREPTIFNNEELNPSYPAAPFFNDYNILIISSGVTSDK